MAEPLYPFDQTGERPGNKVSEIQTVAASTLKDFYVVIPKQTPFFRESFKVRFLDEDRELVEGVDFQFGHSFSQASRTLAKAVYGSIVITDFELKGTIELEYQTMGGDWLIDNTQRYELLAQKLADPRITTWEMVSEAPLHFPAIDHQWNLDDMVGMSDVKIALNGIAEMIEEYAAPANILKDHLNNFMNPHNVTKAQLGLADVENYAPATVNQAKLGENDETVMTPFKTHSAFLHLMDSLLYTKVQMDKIIADNALTHSESADHDRRYYTRDQLDLKFSKTDDFDQHGTYPGLRAKATTKEDVGLSNVDNTSDIDKPVSTAMIDALNTKVSIANIVNNLRSLSVEKPLAAVQGKIIKDFIDNIYEILASNDVALDTVQKIVDYIKASRAKLDSLEISDINLLPEALDSKQDNLTAGQGIAIDDDYVINTEPHIPTNLGYTPNASKGTVLSSTGLPVDLPAATQTQAGLLTSLDKEKLDGVEQGAQVNVVTTVAGKVGDVTLTKDDVNLEQVDNTSDINKPVSTATATELAKKVNTVDIVDNLISDSTTEPLSARQGKVIKALIDDINRIIASDDTSLDEFQEVVNFIKANRHELESLTIDNIAGLVVALESKQDNLTAGSGITLSGNTVINAEPHIPTDLSTTRNAVEYIVESSTGVNTPLEAVTNLLIGLMTPADKIKLDGIEPNAQVNTATTDRRDSGEVDKVLQAKAMSDHIASGDHDTRYLLRDDDLGFSAFETSFDTALNG